MAKGQGKPGVTDLGFGALTCSHNTNDCVKVKEVASRFQTPYGCITPVGEIVTFLPCDPPQREASGIQEVSTSFEVACQSTSASSLSLKK